MRRTAVLALLLVAVLALMSFAQIPNVLSYQGVLKNADGTVVADGDYDLTFGLYLSETGGDSAFWTETQMVTVADGIFGVILGSVEPFDASFRDAYWLGISVEGEPELSPRTPLAAVPYSRCANEVVDSAISTAALRDGAVTSEKIADGTIELSDIGQNGALQAQVIKWDGQEWIVDDDYGTQGAISGVYGIDGLTGGGTSGVIQIGVADGGIQPDMIAPHSITTDQIASGAVEPYQIANGAATDGMVLKWSAGQQSWMPDIDAEGIQGVVAGSGLTGGGQGGEVGLSVDFGGVGQEPTVSHSDHHHDDSYISTGEEDAITPGMVADAVIGTAELVSLSVSTAKLGTGAVTAAKIALSAVIESRIASNAVTRNKLANAVVDSSKLADAAVGTNKLANAAVDGPKLAPAAVATDKLEDSAVTGPKLGTAAVATDKLEDSAVTGAKLGTAAVATDKLEDAAVTGPKLGTAAVATDKLEDAAVTGAKLGTAAVATDKLEDYAVTGAKLQDSAVTGAKIADQSIGFVDLAQNGASNGNVIKWSDTRGGWQAAPDSVGITDVIAGDGLTEMGMGGSGTITLSVDFAGSGSATTVPRSDHDHDAVYVEEGEANSISSDMIVDEEVGSDDLADSSVTTAKIADGTIVSSDIQNSAVTGAKLGIAAVTTDKLEDAAVTGLKLGTAAVATDKLADSAVTGAKIADATIGFEDMAQNGAADGQVMKWDQIGGSWVASDDQGGSGGGGGWVDDGAVVRLEGASDSVGIGTSMPSARLDVAGTLRARRLFVDESLRTEGLLSVHTQTTGAAVFTTDYNSDPGGPAFSAVYAECSASGWDRGDARGVYGKSAVQDDFGIGGKFEGGYIGVEGLVNPAYGGADYYGVSGRVEGGPGTNYGIYGSAEGDAGSSNYGVYGWAEGHIGSNYGIYGVAQGIGGANYAGFFLGDVHVNGTLSKAAGSFKIDHPLDPENKYLSHSFVESPDMMNVYNGNTVLDADGEAIVELPEWFETLNRDFRYQLTCIGGFAPVYVAEELAGNRFSIAGGSPGLKVSWLLTGIRRDRFAEEHRILVEEDKPADERGKYLHPELYGQPEELTLHRVESPE